MSENDYHLKQNQYGFFPDGEYTRADFSSSDSLSTGTSLESLQWSSNCSKDQNPYHIILEQLEVDENESHHKTTKVSQQHIGDGVGLVTDVTHEFSSSCEKHSRGISPVGGSNTAVDGNTTTYVNTSDVERESISPSHNLDISLKDSNTFLPQTLLQVTSTQSKLDISKFPNSHNVHKAMEFMTTYANGPPTPSKELTSNRYELVQVPKNEIAGKQMQGEDESTPRVTPGFITGTKHHQEQFLVNILKRIQNVTIEDLYNLVYNDKSPEYFCHKSHVSTQGGLSTESRKNELNFCHGVVDNLKHTPNYPHIRRKRDLIHPMPSFVNSNEILRIFLAMKILFDIIDRSENTSPIDTSLPVLSVYKVYCILCQRLITKYHTTTHYWNVQQKILLNQYQLGRVARLVFPNLIVRRLGRRGQSKSHYMHLKWNSTTVDQEILNMLALDVRAIHHTFQQLPKNDKKNEVECKTDILYLKEKEAKNKQPTEITYGERKPGLELGGLFQVPLSSFLDFNCKYPSVNCSPRIWNCGRVSILKQSDWANQIMYRSVEVLKHQKINLCPLIKNFTTGVYSDDSPDGLSNTVIQALVTLMSYSSSTGTFMHFYLSVLLLLFPVMVSSEKEVSCISTAQPRASVLNCIARIDNEIMNLGSVDTLHIGKFRIILKRMITINAMTSTKIKSMYPETVLKEIGKDIQYAGYTDCDEHTRTSYLEAMYRKLVLMTFKGYGFDINSVTTTPSEQENTIAINTIARTLATTLLGFADRITSIQSCDKTKDAYSDIPYQMFRIGIEMLHSEVLMNPSISALPIPLVNSMMAQLSNEIQNLIFEKNRNRESDLSSEVFKTWWILSIMFQEYLSIMAEIVALTHHVA